MTDIQPYQTVSRKEVFDLIMRIGPLGRVVYVRGGMGSGKTHLLKDLGKALPTHTPVLLDMSNMQDGDLLMPKVVEIDGHQVCDFVPNMELLLHQDKPLIICWDEFGKAPKTLRSAARRTLLYGQLGRHTLPKGTIQFCTSNLLEEGLGDELMAHQANSVCQVVMRNSTAEEWTQDFALDAGVHPTIIQTVNEFPQMFHSFTEYSVPGDNPYIFDPRQPTNQFSSHRSMTFASDVLWAGSDLPESVLVPALAGYVGMRAALDIMAINKLYGKPRWEEVVKTPTKAEIPDSAGAVCLFIYSAIQKIDAKTLPPLMEYLKRVPMEAQALFATTVMRTAKAGLAAGNKEFLQWAGDNQWLTQS